MSAILAILAMLLVSANVPARGAPLEVDSLASLARAAAQDGQEIRLKPGVYRMTEYLTPEVLAGIRANLEPGRPRPPVPMLVLKGSGNRIDAAGATIEIETTLFGLLPPGGYIRCLIVAGCGNRISGLTIRNTGPNRGSGGNILSVAGDDNTLEDVVLQVRGSFPYGYGDLLGKGGPNLVTLHKQSGIQVLGNRTLLRRCQVSTRAFGHCFYIQAGTGIRIEDCRAEGETRTTLDMLRDASGPAFELGFPSVYPDREGRHLIAPGYTKSLVEDGFRTYSTAGSVALVNCVALNTRAGFEIGARDDAREKTTIDGCLALGCERAYLLGSHVVVRRSRGDIAHGPLLYLRGGRDSDVELELVGKGPVTLVHALATVAGENHRLRLTVHPGDAAHVPFLPILVGYGMPEHAEMASPIRPHTARRIACTNEIAAAPLLVSDQVFDCELRTAGRLLTREKLGRLP